MTLLLNYLICIFYIDAEEI